MHGYNFTESVRRALAKAREAAARMKSNSVSTEHVLLGLIAEAKSTSAHIIAELGADLEELRARLESGRATEPEVTGGGDVSFSTDAKRAFELAMQEAKTLAHDYVGSEHLLIGLLEESQGGAAKLLDARGVTAERARAALRKRAENGMVSRSPNRPQPGLDAKVIRYVVEIRYDDGGSVRSAFESKEKLREWLDRK